MIFFDSYDTMFTILQLQIFILLILLQNHGVKKYGQLKL